jgi:hypothetical protein
MTGTVSLDLHVICIWEGVYWLCRSKSWELVYIRQLIAYHWTMEQRVTGSDELDSNWSSVDY